MPPKTEHKCFLCGQDSQGRVLLACETKGQASWVCAGCLPFIIHGGVAGGEEVEEEA